MSEHARLNRPGASGVRASDAAESPFLTHLISQLEGRRPASPRGTDTDRVPPNRFAFVEFDDELAFEAESARPYSIGLLSPSDCPVPEGYSDIEDVYAWQGQEVSIVVAYTYNEHIPSERLSERQRERTNDDQLIRRCLTGPFSWLIDGVGIVDVDDESEFQDDDESPVMFSIITVRIFTRSAL